MAKMQSAFLIAALSVYLLPSLARSATVGYWRFDNDSGAVGGGTIGTTTSEFNSSALSATGSGGALYSSDVPGRLIGDPVTHTANLNTLSMDASSGNARIAVANDSLLDIDVGGDKSFTLEFFVKLVGEPSSYDSFVRRSESVNGYNRRWQVDFSSGATASSFGKIRSRWDTTDGSSQTDSNNVTTGDYVFVDTDTGSGNPADYTGASGDVQDEGDGLNDDDSWHHIALVYDGTTGQFQIWTDYVAGSLRTLSGAFEQPAGDLLIGKLTGSGYGLLIDEFRYSEGALAPGQFLHAIPEPSTWTLLAAGLGCAAMLRLVRRRKRGRD